MIGITSALILPAFLSMTFDTCGIDGLRQNNEAVFCFFARGIDG
jgi:hypothetical protein